MLSIFGITDSNSKQKVLSTKSQETETTVISQGIFIEGNTFKGHGTVRIDGVFVGEMSVEGHIIVGKTGKIDGNIKADTMLVAGKVTGNIDCKSEVHFAETAQTLGDIKTGTIVIDQGAEINGAIFTNKKVIGEPINLEKTIKHNDKAAG